MTQIQDKNYLQAIDRFQSVYSRAKSSGLKEPTAVNVATVDPEGRPSSRFVLLKAVDQSGFVFYTNYSSRKGRQIQQNKHVALCFFWEPLMEQVRVEGKAEEVSATEADAYWETRRRNSQIGAWASQQSEPLDQRATLERRFEEFKQQFGDRAVPRPPQWSGYRVVPELIEFWVGVDFRLHERTCYRKSGDVWTMTLLNP